MTYQERVKAAVREELAYISENTGGDINSVVVMSTLRATCAGVADLLQIYQKDMEQFDAEGKTDPTLDALVEYEEVVFAATVKLFNILFKGE